MFRPYKKGLTILCSTLLLSTLLLMSNTALAVSINLVDTFSDSTLQGWKMGSSNATIDHMSIVDGGPGGAGDSFLQVTANGTAQAGGRLTFINQLQWSGDYTAAGITTISMDLNNFNSSEALNLRLGIYGGAGDGLGNFSGGLYATSASIILDSGSGWTHVEFSLFASDLVPVNGRTGVTGNDIQAALANVLELRLLNSVAPDWTGLPVTATLGIDNISAVPLPPAVLLFGSGLFLLGAWRRRRNK